MARSAPLLSLSLLTLLFSTTDGGAQPGAPAMGGCIPPVANYTSTAPSPPHLCQGDAVSFNGALSTAAPGRTIEQWVWDLDGNGMDTTEIPFAIFTLAHGGVHLVSLQVIDDIGCVSEWTEPIPFLVSHTPDFSGTQVPELACEGQVFALNAIVQQDLMVRLPENCTPGGISEPILDDQSTPAISTITISGQPNGPIPNVASLGDICVDMEHSFMGDLVITVTCPNGQNVVMHQQGGGGTYIGGALDGETNPPAPGECWTYCWSPIATNGTWAENSGGGSLPAGDYESVQPLDQLVGCPYNGEWTLTINDLAGADDGTLCGWCISLGEGPDSTFVDQGPVLGSSSDSSFWTGPGITNNPGSPGQATLDPIAGMTTLSYTVIDSYGCEHQAVFPISVGTTPEVTIENNTELGLLCAQPLGNFSYQWSYNSQVVVGAEGACYTPPGPGSVAVTVTTPEGCAGSANVLSTGLSDAVGTTTGPVVFPSPNTGEFTLSWTEPTPDGLFVRVLDMTGRVLATEAVPAGALSLACNFPDLVPGSYLLTVGGDGGVVRMVVAR